jgi:hypothetical protein
VIYSEEVVVASDGLLGLFLEPESYLLGVEGFGITGA